MTTAGSKDEIPMKRGHLRRIDDHVEDFYRSIAAARNFGEREHGSRRPEGRIRRRHSHTHATVDHTHPHPIYSPYAQIQDSPTLPPPERTEKGGGIRGGAGETGGDGFALAVAFWREGEKGEGFLFSGGTYVMRYILIKYKREPT
jgi:hypothetical protein